MHRSASSAVVCRALSPHAARLDGVRLADGSAHRGISSLAFEARIATRAHGGVVRFVLVVFAHALVGLRSVSIRWRVWLGRVSGLRRVRLCAVGSTTSRVIADDVV